MASLTGKVGGREELEECLKNVDSSNTDSCEGISNSHEYLRELKRAKGLLVGIDTSIYSDTFHQLIAFHLLAWVLMTMSNYIRSKRPKSQFPILLNLLAVSVYTGLMVFCKVFLDTTSS